MVTHTPGPWTVEHVPWGKSRDTKIVARGAVVAVLVNRLAGDRETQANAVLLNAAPGLLEACRLAADDCDAAARSLSDGDVEGITDGLIDVALALRMALQEATT